MKYPTSVYIRGHDYRVEYVEQMREVDRDFECENYLGTVCDRVIRLHARQSKLNLLDSLIHEILHALFTRNKMLKAAVDSDLEEDFIATLASDVALLLQDSDWFKHPTQKPPITTRIVPEALK